MIVQKIWTDNQIPYVATGFQRQLEKTSNIVKNTDQDRVLVYDGREGVGKSTLAMQHAFQLDNNLCLDNIVFTSKQFKDAIRTLPKHRALIWDECFKGLSSKGALSRANKEIITLLQECRQRNLFIFLVLPTFFLLEKYAAIFRSNVLIHAATYKSNPNLRYFKVYNYENKKLLYLQGKALYDYSKPKIRHSYRFYGKLPPTINKEDYLRKKHEAFKDLDIKDEESKAMKQRNILMGILNKDFGLTQQQIADKLEEKGFGMDRSMVGKAINGDLEGTSL